MTTPMGEEVTAEGFLVISNISKKANVKTLVALAVTYGIEHVLIVGQPKFSFSTHAPPIEDLRRRVSFHTFPSLPECCMFLKERGARLYGVEICDNATAVESATFRGHPCAFMMGNEGAGMSPPQLSACDEFICIPQYGSGTASLNVANACAIVLQYFALSRELQH